LCRTADPREGRTQRAVDIDLCLARLHDHRSLDHQVIRANRLLEFAEICHDRFDLIVEQPAQRAINIEMQCGMIVRLANLRDARHHTAGILQQFFTS
jgi:hypothetical protein